MTTFDFKTGVLSPLVTFSRPSIGTRYNSSGLLETISSGQPRFGYNPISLAALGLLIEEQRTNLIIRSSEFNDAVWSKTNSSITANAVVSPDGTSNADKITESVASGVHNTSTQTIAISNATAYTASIYLKAAERTLVAWYAGSPGQGAIFNLANGTVFGSIVAPPTSSSITSVGNGWYHVSITFTSTTTATAMSVFLCNGAGAFSYTGDGTSGAYLYGAQLEAGSFATSYIPTEASQVTRNADIATITGSNFTSFWNASQGGAQVQALPSTVSGTRPLVQYDDGTANEIIALRGDTTNPELYIVDGGTPQAQLDAGTIAANTAYSMTGWWATNDCRARKDSGAVVTDATATIPAVTQARIGSDGTNYLNGIIASINYYAAFSRQIYTRRKNKVFSPIL